MYRSFICAFAQTIRKDSPMKKTMLPFACLSACRIFVTLISLLWVGSLSVFGQIANGGFETGTFINWTQSGVNGGFANVVQEGACGALVPPPGWSALDTTGIQLSGTWAAIVR